MPKQSKNQKQSSKNYSSSSTSSSKSSVDNCKDVCPKMECKTTVAAEIDLYPEVKCDRVCTRNAGYDVVANIKSKPRCTFTPLCSKKVSDCEFECSFRVGVDADLTCETRIQNATPFAQAVFEVATSAKTKARCVDKKKKSG